jgi:hypothetical protein
MTEPIALDLGTCYMSPESILTAYIINPSHQ